MPKTNDRMLARIVAGRGAIPLPRWLRRVFERIDPNPPRVDLDRMTDEQLARLGLTRDEVARAGAVTRGRADWEPPAYWMIWPGATTRRPCWRDQVPHR